MQNKTKTAKGDAINRTFQIIMRFPVGMHYEYVDLNDENKDFEKTISDRIKGHVAQCVERNGHPIFSPTFKEPKTVRVIEYNKSTHAKKRGGEVFNFDRTYVRAIFARGPSQEISRYRVRRNVPSLNQ